VYRATGRSEQYWGPFGAKQPKTATVPGEVAVFRVVRY
jgi:hypothetical protein